MELEVPCYVCEIDTAYDGVGLLFKLGEKKYKLLSLCVIHYEQLKDEVNKIEHTLKG